MFALTVYQGDLIAGGAFTAAGDVEAPGIARWDGTSWHPIGAGLDGGVFALAVYGGELYAGGGFQKSGDRVLHGIARWDGQEWQPLGTGVNNQVFAFAEYKGDLIVGGDFRDAGGAPDTYEIARWDGANWHSMENGMDLDYVRALVVSGDDLYAGGQFLHAGGVPANSIARWDGQSWHALDDGLDRWVSALAVVDGDLHRGWILPQRQRDLQRASGPMERDRVVSVRRGPRKRGGPCDPPDRCRLDDRWLVHHDRWRLLVLHRPMGTVSVPRSASARTPSNRPVLRSPADSKGVSTVMAAGGWRIAFALLLLAVLVRGIFLLEMSASPLFRIPLVDAETYNTLARQLAERRQWSKDFFWQPPLYPFFLSLTYALTGSSMVAAKIIQALIGGVTCSLTFVLGALLLGRRVGIVAGIIVAFYMPLVFFESDLIAAGLAAFWSVVLMLLLLEHHRAGGRWVALCLGFTAALAILTRPTFLPFLVGAFVWLIVVSRRRAGIRAAASAGLLALCGFAVAAIPAAVINGSRVSGNYTILPSSGGINFYIGNNPNVCETLTARPGWEWSELTALPYREGVERRADQEAFYYGKVRQFLKSDPVGFLRNLGLKTARFFSSREIPRNVDPYACRPWSHLLSALFWKVGGFGFPFGFLLPLAVVGAWRNRAKVPIVLWLFLIAFPLAVIAVFVADRYRVPMIPVLSILAAAGLGAIVQAVRARNGRATALTSAVIAATMLISCLPGPFCEEKGNSAAELDFMLGLASFNRSRIEADPRAAANDIEVAGRYYEKAIASNPDLADAYSELGNLSFARGEYREAGDFYAKALEIQPDHGKALHSLGVLLFLAGSNDPALDCLRQAQKLDPSFPKTYFFLGQALLKGETRRRRSRFCARPSAWRRTRSTGRWA